jgi:N-methylhydantoinase A
MPFGGGGALHSGALIKEVGLASALVPRFPGVTSALGCVIADMRHDYVHTLNRMLADLDVPALINEISHIADDGEQLLQRSGISLAAIEHRFELDMLYLGQTHTVTVPLPVTRQTLMQLSHEVIQNAFENTYREHFGRLLDNIPQRVMNLRVAVIGKRPKFDLQLLAPAATGSVDEARLGQRHVWIDGDWVDAKIYDRLPLPVGTRILGPALLEQSDATIWIEPDLQGEVDLFGNLLINRV